MPMLLLPGNGSFLSHAGDQDTAFLLHIKGPIGPAISDYVQRGIKKAAEENAAMVILQMDTPGGLVHSMRDIIKSILSSPVPVVTYVAPGRSRTP